MTIEIEVRTGPYQYVLTRLDGSAVTLDVSPAEREEGMAAVDVSEGDTVMEVALASTSDPDLDPARGRLWPAEDR